MTTFLNRRKQRKLVQWTLAYLAGGWLLLQVADLASANYHWPETVMHVLFAVLPFENLSTDKANGYFADGMQDPKFALAWADLALGQSFRVYFGQAGTASMRKQALANAQHALALEPDLPQAHFALGYVYRFDFADYRRALAQFEIARRGLPNDAMVEAAIGYIHAIQGHLALAEVNLQRAATLNPLDPNVIYSYAQVLSKLRRYDESRAVLHHLLAIAPGDPEAYATLAQVDLLQHGDVRAAMRWLDQAPAELQSKPSMLRQRLSVLMIQRDAARPVA